MWFNAIGLELSWKTAVFAHLVWIIPVVTLVISIQVYSFDPALEEAAFDLGATRWQVLREVTLPVLLPGIVSGSLFAFLLSWGNFPLSLFTTGADTTIPEYLYAKMVAGYTPGVPVLGTVSTFGAALLLLGGYWLISRAPAAQECKRGCLIMFTSLAGQVRRRHRLEQGHRQGHCRVFAKAGCKVLIVSRHLAEAKRRRRNWAKAHPPLPPMSRSSTAWMRWRKPPPTGMAASTYSAPMPACFRPHKLEDMTSEQWDLVVDTNLKGTFHVGEGLHSLSQEIVAGPRSS